MCLDVEGSRTLLPFSPHSSQKDENRALKVNLHTLLCSGKHQSGFMVWGCENRRHWWLLDPRAIWSLFGHKGEHKCPARGHYVGL